MKLGANKTVDHASFFLEMRPNRSLTRAERQQWFLYIAGATILFAGAATAIGAWMVLPFAGFEILFLWCAFQLIGRHDDDYEWVQVAERQFSWSRCECGQVEMLSGNAAWVHLFAVARNGQVDVGLRYQGKTVLIGKMISDEQRVLLCRNLVRVLK